MDIIFEKEVHNVLGKGAPKLLPNCRFGPFSSRKVGDSVEIDVFAYMIDNEQERCVWSEGFASPKLHGNNGQPPKFPSGTFSIVEVPKEFISSATFVKNQISRAPYDSIFLQNRPLDPLQRVLVQINGFVIKDYDTAIKVVERSGEHLKLVFFEPEIVDTNSIDTDSISGALLAMKKSNSDKVFAEAMEILLKCVTNITNDPKNGIYNCFAGGIETLSEFVTNITDNKVSRLGNLEGGHECLLALGFVAEEKWGKTKYRFSEDKIETFRQAKEAIATASKIIKLDEDLLKNASRKFSKRASNIVDIQMTGFEYPEPGKCSLIKTHSPDAKTTRLGEDILVSKENDPHKVVIGEVYSGDSPYAVEQKVTQLERNVREYCNRCANHSKRSFRVDDDAFDFTSIVGLAVLHLNGCGMKCKQVLEQYREQVGNALSQSATPFLWRLRRSERFVLHVVSSEEAAQTYEFMSIRHELRSIRQEIRDGKLFVIVMMIIQTFVLYTRK